MDYTVLGIIQARILEWVAFASSRGSSQPGIEPMSPALQVDSLPEVPDTKYHVHLKKHTVAFRSVFENITKLN